MNPESTLQIKDFVDSLGCRPPSSSAVLSTSTSLNDRLRAVTPPPAGRTSCSAGPSPRVLREHGQDDCPRARCHTRAASVPRFHHPNDSVIHEVHKSKSVQPHLVESQALRVFSSYFGSRLKRPDALGIPFHNHRLWAQGDRFFLDFPSPPSTVARTGKCWSPWNNEDAGSNDLESGKRQRLHRWRLVWLTADWMRSSRRSCRARP